MDELRQGVEKFQVGDLVGAELIAAFDQAIATNPTPQAHCLRGNARWDSQDYNGAVADYSRAIELDPNTIDAYWGRGTALYRLGDKQRAIADVTRVIYMNPRHPLAYSLRGGMQFDLQDYEWAIADHTQAIRVNPNNAVAYGGRALARYELGDRQGALEDLTQSIQLDLQPANSYYCRANVLLEIGRTTDALADFQQVVECWRQQGNQEQCDRALHHIQTLYRQGISATHSPAKTAIAQGVEQLKQGDTASAVATLTQAIQQDGAISSATAEGTADAYQLRGTIYLNQNKVNQAIADFTEALRRNPDLADAYYNRGCAYFDTRQLAAALEDFTQAIRRDPYLAGAYYNRGSVLLGLDDREGAIANLKTAIHLLQQQGNQQQYEWVMNQLQALQQG